ncbi:STAS domain-containing protein [Herpetosiphon giganteus]|uniref:STAS domain-containing protein n=1 Tax=Herpetosiphon giganteus TaxID=2029754 RepID=UPI001959E637|nr:STAS domain-containing protein [Herpetosiphon giganteus]MBM7844481.1 rsbT co-antagonist protein RsbR [Herpetosiphon giganteus]
MQIILDHVQAHFDQYVKAATNRVFNAKINLYRSFSYEQLETSIRYAYTAFVTDLNNGTVQEMSNFLLRIGPQRAEQGASVEDILFGINMGVEVISNDLLQTFESNPSALLWWMQRMHAIIYTGAMKLSDTILKLREQHIREQASQIAEISTPIIPLSQGVLVVPLIGTLGEYRASRITEALLNRISEEQASTVLIDVTGVPVVDTQVAHHLIQSAQAAKLVGAEVLLVGIRPEMAQTLVQLGVNLQGVRTQGTLQAGVEYAFERQKQQAAKAYRR